MILTMSIYGFGSYFKGASAYQDIDLLIVHNSTDYSACLAAISLKNSILQEIGSAGVSILSRVAELEFDFIQRSQAILLVEIEGSYKDSELMELFRKVNTYKKT